MQFAVTLTNSEAYTTYALLCPGLIENAQGLIATGAFNDAQTGGEGGGGFPGLSGTGSPQSIEVLNAFIRTNPSKLYGLRIKSTTADQLYQAITIQKEWPFGTLEDENIMLAAYTDDRKFNDKVATIKIPAWMDYQTKITLPVVANSTCIITFLFDKI